MRIVSSEQICPFHLDSEKTSKMVKILLKSIDVFSNAKCIAIDGSFFLSQKCIGVIGRFSVIFFMQMLYSKWVVFSCVKNALKSMVLFLLETEFSHERDAHKFQFVKIVAHRLPCIWQFFFLLANFL